ncbi:MAG: hypothetical protein ABI359_14960 [Ginsengibacter sp.]
MKNLTEIYPKPPTRKMLEKLKDCLEKNNNQISIPCLPKDLKSSLAGLYKRGLIETKMEVVNDKKMLCIYVTEPGKKLLIEFEVI